MIVEHLFYTGALAVIAGLVLSYRGIDDERPYVLIVLGASLVPDFTWFVFEALSLSGIVLPYQSLVPGQASLHTLAGLAVFTLLAALTLRRFHLRSPYIALCCVLGYGSHLLEDGLTHTTRYVLLWPLSSEHVGIGLFVPYTPDIFGIAEARVLVVGLILFALAIAARTAIEGKTWMRVYAGGSRTRKVRAATRANNR
jgi:hypothetical protein